MGKLGPINRFFAETSTHDGVVMDDLTAEELDRAFTYLSEARKILFKQLHDGSTRSQGLVEGVDKLAAAFELAENPRLLNYICPACESLATESRDDGMFHCFSCDEEWS